MLLSVLSAVVKMNCLWFLYYSHLPEFILFSFQIFNVNQVTLFLSSRNWLCKNAFIIYNIFGIFTKFSPFFFSGFRIHVVIFSRGVALHFNLATALRIIFFIILTTILIVVVIVVTLVGLALIVSIVSIHVLSTIKIIVVTLRVLLVANSIILRQERLIITLIHICYQIMYYKIK